MSETWIDKWSQIDGRTTAHWWLGAEGTACGLDFHSNIQRAYADDPRCQRCAAHPASAPASARALPRTQEDG